MERRQVVTLTMNGTFRMPEKSALMFGLELKVSRLIIA